jgi:hypothetical protein
MTLLTIVNKVLRRLREDTVSSVAESEYSKLIGEFVNEAKEQMEDMWFWSVYETAVSTSILGDSSTTDYDLTATNDRSFLIRRERDQLPMAFDVTSPWLSPLNSQSSPTQTVAATPLSSSIPHPQHGLGRRTGTSHKIPLQSTRATMIPISSCLPFRLSRALFCPLSTSAAKRWASRVMSQSVDSIAPSRLLRSLTCRSIRYLTERYDEP